MQVYKFCQILPSFFSFSSAHFTLFSLRTSHLVYELPKRDYEAFIRTASRKQPVPPIKAGYESHLLN